VNRRLPPGGLLRVDHEHVVLGGLAHRGLELETSLSATFVSGIPMLAGSVTADPAASAAKAIDPRNSDPPVGATPFRLQRRRQGPATTPSIQPSLPAGHAIGLTPSDDAMARRTTSTAPAVAEPGITPKGHICQFGACGLP
jgi:hypothetical protein